MANESLCHSDTMQQDYRELWDEARYRKVLEIRHEDILYFIAGQLRPNNPAMRFFYAFNMILIVWFLITIWKDTGTAPFSLLSASMFFIAGIPLFLILLVPLHELLHALVFFLLGARKVRIIPKWKKLMVYAVADKFVMNFREFVFLALTPFVVINVVLVLLLVFVPEVVKYAIWSALFFHATGCIGDFALLGFLSRNNPAKTVNYDDFSEQKTFFFEKISNVD
ncbi:MAG TPA: DUF3267 domain-containing protein [Bacteroidales bacterium]|nr:DUF3267 domain-containing protein [Bacteroidales bacterium]